MNRLQKLATTLLNKHTYLLLLITTLLAFEFALIGSNSWKFAYTGDDWSFYFSAQDVLKQHFLLNPFDMKGVFHTNPMIGSMYQALFLFVFGDTNFSWRLSNIVLIIPISLFFFLWLRQLFGSTISLFSTIFLQCSFFLSNYLKIGYINPQAFALMLVCLYLTTVAVKTQQKKFYLLLGIVLGLAFYVYIGPLFLLLIIPTFFLTRESALRRKTFFINLLLLLFIYLLIILPGLLDHAHWETTSAKTIINKEFAGNIQVLENIGSSLFLFYHNNDYLYNHFIAGPYFDRITQDFTAIGTLLVLWYVFFKKQRVYIIFLATYLLLIFLIGISSPYPYTPTTRGIFFLPFGAAFAGIALASVMQRFSIKPLILGVFFTCVFLLNVYQSQIGVFKQTGHPATGLILKALQESEPEDTIILYQSSQKSYQNPILPLIQKAYGLEEIKLTTIIAPTPSCTMIKATQILYFPEDKKKIVKLTCFKTHHKQFTELLPAFRA